VSLANLIKNNASLKKIASWMISADGGIRPRWWVRRLVNPFYHKRGKRTRIFSRARIDVMPFQVFELGDEVTLEDFTFINNGMGAVTIGDHSFIGAMNVLIGPISIGSHIMTAQNVVMSGLNHGFNQVTLGFRYQPCTTAPIVVGDGCWIGANVVVTAGVCIGKYCVIAAGSVVTKNMPDYCMAAGNPAKIIKQFNFNTQQWEKLLG
jgi:acetyltransferase-like isoleucine patch superfamily enzyme